MVFFEWRHPIPVIVDKKTALANASCIELAMETHDQDNFKHTDRRTDEQNTSKHTDADVVVQIEELQIIDDRSKARHTAINRPSQTSRLKKKLKKLQAQAMHLSSPWSSSPTAKQNDSNIQGLFCDSFVPLAGALDHTCKGGKPCVDVLIKGKCRAGEACKFCHSHARDPDKFKRSWQSSRLKRQIAAFG